MPNPIGMATWLARKFICVYLYVTQKLNILLMPIYASPVRTGKVPTETVGPDEYGNLACAQV